MDTWLIVLIVAIAVVIVAALVIGAAVQHRRRTDRLRQRFGPQYDQTLQEENNRRLAEARLQQAEQRHDRVALHPFDVATRSRYLERWHEVQAHFVDQPSESLGSADALVIDVMRERGYPIADLDTRLAMVALDHPRMLAPYRSATEVCERARTRSASTEDVRLAMIAYRTLFEDLLAASAAPNHEAPASIAAV